MSHGTINHPLLYSSTSSSLKTEGSAGSTDLKICCSTYSDTENSTGNPEFKIYSSSSSNSSPSSDNENTTTGSTTNTNSNGNSNSNSNSNSNDGHDHEHDDYITIDRIVTNENNADISTLFFGFSTQGAPVCRPNKPIYFDGRPRTSAFWEPLRARRTEAAQELEGEEKGGDHEGGERGEGQHGNNNSSSNSSSGSGSGSGSGSSSGSDFSDATKCSSGFLWAGRSSLSPPLHEGPKERAEDEEKEERTEEEERKEEEKVSTIVDLENQNEKQEKIIIRLVDACHRAIANNHTLEAKSTDLEAKSADFEARSQDLEAWVKEMLALTIDLRVQHDDRSIRVLDLQEENKHLRTANGKLNGDNRQLRSECDDIRKKLAAMSKMEIDPLSLVDAIRARETPVERAEELLASARCDHIKQAATGPDTGGALSAMHRLTPATPILSPPSSLSIKCTTSRCNPLSPTTSSLAPVGVSSSRVDEVLTPAAPPPLSFSGPPIPFMVSVAPQKSAITSGGARAGPCELTFYNAHPATSNSESTAAQVEVRGAEQVTTEVARAVKQALSLQVMRPSVCFTDVLSPSSSKIDINISRNERTTSSEDYEASTAHDAASDDAAHPPDNSENAACEAAFSAAGFSADGLKNEASMEQASAHRECPRHVTPSPLPSADGSSFVSGFPSAAADQEEKIENEASETMFSTAELLLDCSENGSKVAQASVDFGSPLNATSLPSPNTDRKIPVGESPSVTAGQEGIPHTAMPVLPTKMSMTFVDNETARSATGARSIFNACTATACVVEEAVEDYPFPSVISPGHAPRFHSARPVKKNVPDTAASIATTATAGDFADAEEKYGVGWVLKEISSMRAEYERTKMAAEDQSALAVVKARAGTRTMTLSRSASQSGSILPEAATLYGRASANIFRKLPSPLRLPLPLLWPTAFDRAPSSSAEKRRRFYMSKVDLNSRRPVPAFWHTMPTEGHINASMNIADVNDDRRGRRITYHLKRIRRSDAGQSTIQVGDSGDFGGMAREGDGKAGLVKNTVSTGRRGAPRIAALQEGSGGYLASRVDSEDWAAGPGGQKHESFGRRGRLIGAGSTSSRQPRSAMLRPGYFAATVHGATQQPARRRSGGAKKTTTTATTQKLSSCVTETVASRMRSKHAVRGGSTLPEMKM